MNYYRVTKTILLLIISVTNVTVGVTRQAVSVLEGELLQFCLQILEGVVQEEALVIAASTFNGTAFGKNRQLQQISI